MQPAPINLGGVWIFNPPEPTAQTTELRGAAPFTATTPAGAASAIPPAWRLVVASNSPEVWPATWLVGEFLLYRKPLKLGSEVWFNEDPDVVSGLHEVDGNRFLGRWESLTPRDLYPDDEDVDDSIPPGHDVFQHRPAWSLYYGRYIREGTGNDLVGWWLVPFWRRIEAVFRGGLLYYFRHSVTDPGSLQTPAPADANENTFANFDSLSGNSFRIHEFEDDPGEWIAGNLDLTIEPFWF